MEAKTYAGYSSLMMMRTYQMRIGRGDYCGSYSVDSMLLETYISMMTGAASLGTPRHLFHPTMDRFRLDVGLL
jgi:hypothetical protein